MFLLLRTPTAPVDRYTANSTRRVGAATLIDKAERIGTNVLRTTAQRIGPNTLHAKARRIN